MVRWKHLPCIKLIARHHSASMSVSRQSAELSILSLEEVHLLGHKRVLMCPLGSVIDGLWNISCCWIVHGRNMLRSNWHRLGSLCRWGRWRVRGLALARSRLLMTVSSCERAARLIGQILFVIVNTLHMIEQVVPSREPTARCAAVTARIVAQVRSFAVPMHAVCFSFVPEQTSSRGELLLGTRFHLASEGLQVRINELAVRRIRWLVYVDIFERGHSKSYS